MPPMSRMTNDDICLGLPLLTFDINPVRDGAQQTSASNFIHTVKYYINFTFRLNPPK